MADHPSRTGYRVDGSGAQLSSDTLTSGQDDHVHEEQPATNLLASPSSTIAEIVVRSSPGAATDTSVTTTDTNTFAVSALKIDGARHSRKRKSSILGLVSSTRSTKKPKLEVNALLQLSSRSSCTTRRETGSDDASVDSFLDPAPDEEQLHVCTEEDYFFQLGRQVNNTLDRHVSYDQVDEDILDAVAVYRSDQQTGPEDVDSSQDDAVSSNGEDREVRVTSQLDHSSPPVHDINEIFGLIALRAEQLQIRQALEPLKSQPLRIVTMCSGTESPILSMKLLQQAFLQHGITGFNFQHLASAEIEPFKQAYIERNFSPPVIFRDVTEFKEADEPGREPYEPHTAYGGRAKKPEDVHILIAGSSCVDYSRLNSKPKAFGAEGESWSTMTGICAYVKSHRPNIVILENVRGANWKAIVDMYEGLGYTAGYVLVDSKDYYIPQTRGRGYMVAVDKHRIEELGLDETKIVGHWQRLMVAFRKRASAPYTYFIDGEDEVELGFSKHVLEQEKRQPNSSNWAKCRVRYAAYRGGKQLGSLRPLSLWQNNGSCTFPDFYWQFWLKRQVERIWDTLDINFLRHVADQRYDMSYKNRYIDLSQNVDRDCDSRHWGIVACVTPSGIPFETFRGGPITGREALRLQGIPVDDLILSRESSRQLQDLAGNAMTTTVIGSAILSAIIAAAVLDQRPAGVPVSMLGDYRIAYHDEPSSAINVSAKLQPEDEAALLMGMQLLDMSDKYQPNISSKAILEVASLSRQLCLCEGSVNKQSTIFMFCKQCGHTVCFSCHGHPKHDYIEIDEKSLEVQRLLPRAFIDMITQALPRSLQFSASNGTGLDEAGRSTIDNDNETVSGSCKKLLLDQYRFAGIKRDKEWRVQFKSLSGTLELRFSPQLKSEVADGARYYGNVFEAMPMTCYWLLFVNARGATMIASRLQEILADPVARMTPQDSLFDGIWMFQSSPPDVTELVFTPMLSSIPAWEATLGLRAPAYESLKRYSTIKITSKNNNSSASLSKRLVKHCTYRLLESCGGANGSLYREISDGTEGTAMFLFLDPEPMGEAKYDRFVFSNQNMRRSQNNQRDIVGRLPQSWRAIEGNGNFEKVIPCEMVCWVGQNNVALEAVPLTSNEIAAIRDFSTHSPGATDRDCNAFMPLLVAKVPLNSKQCRRWRDGIHYPVDLIHGSQVLQDLNWCLKAIGRTALLDRRGLLPAGKWQVISETIGTNLTCGTCYPPAPDLTWKLVRNPRGRSIVIRPFEDAEKAAVFERALKARPSIISSSICGSGIHATIVIKMNLVAMMHRVQSLLDSSMRDISSSVTTEWRITSHDSTQMAASFPCVTLQSCSGYEKWSGIPNQVTSFTSASAVMPPNFKRQLRGRQLRTLSWLQTRESGHLTWLEREQLEVCLPNLDWCIEVRASQPKTIHGGILADEVGSGKTTTMLALVATDTPTTRSQTQTNGGNSSTRIQSDAALILVPQNIVDQWIGEIQDCFEETHGLVLKISTVEDLFQLKIDDLRNYPIILSSWDIFDHEDYWTRMRHLAAAPNVPERPGRAFKQWHTEALQNLGDFIASSEQCQNVEQFFKHRTLKKDEIIGGCKKYDGYLKRKDVIHTAKQLRVTGLRLEEDLTKQMANPLPLKHLGASTDEQEGIEDETEIEMKQIIHPLFHLFDFHRIIIDEFTYLTGRPLIAVLGLAARSRWQLSGTPPLSDYDSVNTMAKLMGTKISNVDEGKGCFGFGKDADNMNATKSYAEEFHHYRAVESVSNKESRYELAHKFGAEFIRQDKANLSNINKEDHIIVVNPSALELMQYLEFLLPLQTKLFQFKRSKTSKTSNPATRREFIEEEIERCDNAEQALVTCHSILKALFADKPTSFGEIRQAMEADFIQSCKTLESEFRAAFWCDARYVVKSLQRDHDQDNLREFVHRALSPSDLGDSALAKLMNSLVWCAFDSQTKPETLLIDADLIKKHTKQLEEYQKKVNKVKTKAKKQPAMTDQTDSEPVSDDGASQTVKLNKLSDMPKGLHEVEELETDANLRQKEARARITLLNSILQQLTPVAQSLRVLKAIESVSLNLPLLSCSLCQKPTVHNSKVLVNIVCGHVFHEACLVMHDNTSTEAQVCQAHGCNTLADTQTLISAERFSSSQTSQPTQHGTLMTAVLQQIRDIPKDDNILIFVQFAAVGEHLVKSLKEAGIAHVDARKGAYMSAKGVQKFKQNIKLGKKGRARVLILAINTADSAGWNLQEVNHVMFLTPLVTESQHEYDSIMKQAVGRAYRYRQEKNVHVYHFAISGTVGVNILEDRRKQVIVKRDGGFKFVGETEMQEDEVRFNGIWHKRYVGSSKGVEGDHNGAETREAGDDDE